MSETTGGDGRPRYYIQTPDGGFIETSKPGFIEADIPADNGYFGLLANANQWRHERDEARRWARIMRYNFDYWNGEAQRLGERLERLHAENKALRAEVERLKHLLPPPQTPYDGVMAISYPLAGQDTDDQ